MSLLRKKLIRLAYSNEALRPVLLPLLKKAVTREPGQVFARDTVRDIATATRTAPNFPWFWSRNCEYVFEFFDEGFRGLYLSVTCFNAQGKERWEGTTLVDMGDSVVQVVKDARNAYLDR